MRDERAATPKEIRDRERAAEVLGLDLEVAPAGTRPSARVLEGVARIQATARDGGSVPYPEVHAKLCTLSPTSGPAEGPGAVAIDVGDASVNRAADAVEVKAHRKNLRRYRRRLRDRVYRLAAKREKERPAFGSRLDREAKALRALGKATACCGRSNARGTCPSGHKVAHVLRCSKEGCGCASAAPGGPRPAPGAKGGRRMYWGPALRRRYARAVDRLVWAKVWAEIVVTLPPELVARFRSRAGIGELHAITRAVAMELYPEAVGGMTRVHLWGDKSDHLRPHGNALVPLGPGQAWFVTKGKLAGARVLLAKLLRCDVKRVNLWVQQTGNGLHKGDRRAHRLRYVLRDVTMGYDDQDRWHAHLLTCPEEDLVLLAHGLKGVHLTRWWGEIGGRKWKEFRELPHVKAGIAAAKRAKFGEEGANDRAEEAVNKGCCPACDVRMTWERRRQQVEHEEIHNGTGELTLWYELEDGFWVDEATRAAIARRANGHGRPPPVEVNPGSENVARRAA